MGNRHFTLIIAGNNPDEMIKKYSYTANIEHIKMYELSKAGEYHNKYIKLYEELCKDKNITEIEKKHAEQLLDYYKSIDDIDFYTDLTDGLDIDDETGDAYTDSNPNGKYDVCRIGDHLSMPLINKKGEETFSDVKKNIDWGKIHLYNKDVYKRTWEMVMEGSNPENDNEKNIYENMKNRKTYFCRFETKDNYVLSNTAFWGYAFLDENGWNELSENEDQFKWVNNFYDRFIKPLNDETLISVYECVRY